MKKFSPVAAVFKEDSSDLSEKLWRFSDSYGFVTTFNRFFGEYSVLLCYDYIAERKSANKFKGALAMKNKRTILSTILALVLAMSFIIASAAVISANDNKSSGPQKKICVAAGETSDSCGTQSFENFVKGLSSLTEQEKATLIADLEQIETLEKKIDEFYARMTDENADSLYDEINAVDSKLAAVLERNAKLWERVNDEYDEKIAAKEPDMTLDPAEEDFNGHCTEKEETYEESIKGMTSLTEQEKAALLADLAEIEALEKRVDTLYASINDENADRLYDEIDALEDKIAEILERNAELWDRVDAEYDEKIAANEKDIPFDLNEEEYSVCKKRR